MSGIIEDAYSKLVEVLDGKVDAAHGIDHAAMVLVHAQEALREYKGAISGDEMIAVQLAALLHDADDGKFFKGTRNAETILEKVAEPHVGELALRMINLVSCSKNGNSKEGVEHEWMLYPRHADRLEAIGEIGIWRCWQYTEHVKRPIAAPDTPLAKNLKEVEEIAPFSRFENYVNKQGKVGSSSFIDHFYDKLLHICDLGDNPYFKDAAVIKKKIMQDFLIDFGQNGKVNEEFIGRLSDKFRLPPK